MCESDKSLRCSLIAFLAEFENADQETKEAEVKIIKEGLEGKLSDGGQAFIDDLCKLILTGEPNDVSKFLGLIS